VHNGTNSMGLIVQNGNLSLNSGMNASRARPALRPSHPVSNSEPRPGLREANNENTCSFREYGGADPARVPQRPLEDGEQLAVYRETWSEAVVEFRLEVSMRRSTLSFFEQLLAALPSAQDSPGRIGRPPER
jgi:hypothetical protein